MNSPVVLLTQQEVNEWLFAKIDELEAKLMEIEMTAQARIDVLTQSIQASTAELDAATKPKE